MKIDFKTWIKSHKLATTVIVLVVLLVLTLFRSEPEQIKTQIVETKVIEKVKELDPQEIKELKSDIANYERILKIDNETIDVAANSMSLCGDGVTFASQGNISQLERLTLKIIENNSKIDTLTERRASLYSAIHK